MAQLPPASGPDYGDAGAFFAIVVTAVTGAWTWWKANHKDKDKEPESRKEDPDLASISALKETMIAIQEENKRLRLDNERIWQRYTELQDAHVKLQQKVARLYREFNIQNGTQ